MLAPFFLESGPGRILCTVFRPEDCASGGPGLVFVPPFAEEMNKSRHVVARLAHRLSERGFTTVVPDLHGTGDSDGDFADADWDIWRGNVVDAARWLLEQGCGTFWLGGLRLGASLAVDVLPAMPQPAHSLLLWQPVPAGRSAMTQFLRLRAAASLSSGAERETVSTLRARLADGEPLEIGGYMLSPRLFEAVECLDLATAPPSGDVQVAWFEISRTADGDLLPATRQLRDAWHGCGQAVDPELLDGEAFWSTQELAAAPALVDASVARLAGRHA